MMLFKILKLLGLDVPAKMAAAKSEIEQRVEEVVDYAKQATQTAAAIGGLSAAAGVLAAMAVGVGLYALYRVAESYGVNAGLGVVAAALVAATLILLLIARTKGAALANRHIFKPLSHLPTSAASVPNAPAAPVQVPMSAVFAATPDESAGDLVEPLAFLLGKYVNFPALGHPVLDELVGNLRTSARGTAEEAVERAANLVRQGDRTQLLIMLGGAAIVGWLLARQNPNATLRDITPAE
jgi:hypothetical protein